MATEWESTDETPKAEAGPGAAEMSFAQYWSVLVKRRRLIALCVVLCLALAAVVSVLSRPLYQASAVLEVSGGGASPLEANAMGQRSLSADGEFLPTQMRLMKSRQVAERVVRRLNRAAKPEPGQPADPNALDPVTAAALSLQKGVDAQPIRGTNLVEISYVAVSADAAALMANAFAEAYIESTVDARLQLAGDTSAFLSTQIEWLRKELAQKEQEALSFRRQNDLATTDAKTNVTMANLDALNADYAAAVRDRVAKESRYTELKTARPEAIADSASDVGLQQLRTEQARLEREYSDKLSLFKPEWPAMVQLKSQIDRGRQQILALVEQNAARLRGAAEAELQTAQRREENLKAELRSQKSTVINLNSNELEYSERGLELQSKKALLDSLLKRKAEADVVTRLGGERASYARIVERALRPAAPFRPSYSRNGLLGLFGGLAVGVGLAFLVSHLDRSLRTAQQVEDALQLPALGLIPSLGQGSGWVYRYASGSRSPKLKAAAGAGAEEIELLPHLQPRAPIAESYRAFRTSLLLSRAGGVQSITVTSALPREGKTVTAANLAIVLSQLGKKVLLIDADLHRPRLHEIFLVSNRTGLVSILAEGVPAESAIARTSIPDLFVLPSGPASPNPSGLLSSEAMAALLDRARLAYDHVILDTPPVLPVADAMVLGHLTDGAILCVRAGQTPRDQVARVRERMVRGGTRVLGVLLNGLMDEDERYRDARPYGYAPEAEPAAASARSSAAGSGPG